jgi:hypothetical protein
MTSVKETPEEIAWYAVPTRHGGWWAVARGQLLNPMNIMLLIVGAASIAIGQVPTQDCLLSHPGGPGGRAHRRERAGGKEQHAI